MDGIEAGAGPMTLEGVGAGAHTLSATLDGHAPHVQSVVVAPDAVTRVDVELVPAPAWAAGAWPQLVLSTAVTAAGGILAVDALLRYGTAREAFQRYLDEPDDATAEALYEREVRPERRRAAIEGTGAAVLLSTGVVWWMRTDLAVSASASQLTVHRRW